MIFDLRNPSVSDWHEHLADDHERINFPDTHFQFLLKIANALLKKQLIDELQWLDMYDIALGARDDAHEKQASHPCAIVMSERQALVDVETGQVRGHTKHGTFRLDGMDDYCHFTRDPSGRMTARDKKLYQEFGRFESEELVRIKGRLYRVTAEPGTQS